MDLASCFSLNTILICFSFLILGCLCATKLSNWMSMPCLLLFLIVGLLMGEDGLGFVFNNAIFANYLGSVAMAFILFSGGFDTRWKSIRHTLVSGTILSTIGVLLTALSVGLFAWFILPFFQDGKLVPISGCFLLGAIISSTDAAAVFSILRSKSVSLRGRLQPLLEFESGSNDPMATFLTLFMLSIVSQELATGEVFHFSDYLIIFPSALFKMGGGILIGWVVGYASTMLFNRINFEYDGLYYVLSLVIVLISFSAAEALSTNGFMSVYVTGLVMGNMKFVFHNGIGKFNDGIAWLMQVILFAMLGLLAMPSIIWQVKWIGLTIAAFLMFFARPIVVYLCLLFSKFSWTERTLVAWVGLRGGAPIMLATFVLIASIPFSSLLFHIIFFIVLTAVLIQGMTIMPLAKLLKLDSPLKKSSRVPLSFEQTGTSDVGNREFLITEQDDGKLLSELNLPGDVLVTLIKRDDQFIIPRGDIHVMNEDILMMIGPDQALEKTALRLQLAD